MSEKKLLEIMEEIPQFETFSKYSISLNKKYKKCCLKSLINDLRNPKHFQEYGNSIIKPIKKDKHLYYILINLIALMIIILQMK